MQIRLLSDLFYNAWLRVPLPHVLISTAIYIVLSTSLSHKRLPIVWQMNTLFLRNSIEKRRYNFYRC